MGIVLVTGSTDGIGKETARTLVQRGAQVIVHGRTRDKAEATRAELGASAAVFADLSVLDEVRRMAGALDAVDVLVNNAGIYTKARTLTADGRELTMAVNHDAPVLLAHLLLPKLERVINVSSGVHGQGHVDVDDIDLARDFSPMAAYASSKLANVLFTLELARRAPNKRVNAVHPGVVSTKLLRAGFSMNGPDSLAEGASTSVHLALDDVTATGKYFADEQERAPARAALDRTLCARFYEASCARVGVQPLSN
ncbi:MAG TPA: SDR family NAD(P)-dependent oxidoreductase [Myxococcota bacterium]